MGEAMMLVVVGLGFVAAICVGKKVFCSQPAGPRCVTCRLDMEYAGAQLDHAITDRFLGSGDGVGMVRGAMIHSFQCPGCGKRIAIR